MHAEVVRTALAAYGNLAVDALTLGDDDDLYAAGLTSHATISVMLAIEDELGTEFPESLLRKSTFASVASIENALSQIAQSV